MATVAASRIDGGPALDEPFAEPGSTSRFTAVNGPLSPQQSIANGVATDPAIQEGQMAANTHGITLPEPDIKDDRPISPPEAAARPILPSWSDHLEERRASPARKRAYPEAFGDTPPQPYHVRPPPASENANLDARDQERPQDTNRAMDPPYHLTDHERRRPLSREYDRVGPSPVDYERQQAAYQSPTYAYPPPPSNDETDVRLIEALGRGSGEMAHMRSNSGIVEEEEQRRKQNGEYSATTYRTANAGSEADRKRRKRQFSNRTKTGCLTCRKRKKKCDEQHPECQNCLRGDFVCEGYSIRSNWQKPTPSRTPVPLKSKPDGTPMGLNSPLMHHSELSPEYATDPSISSGRDGPAPPAGRDGRRPSGLEEASRDRGYQSPPSDYRSSYGKRTHPTSGYENPNESTDHSTPYAYTGPRPQSATFPTTPHHAPAAAVAAAALSAPGLNERPKASRSRRGEEWKDIDIHLPPPRDHGALARPLTERESMLRGEYYLPYTKALMEDRECCAAAVWRYNNSTNPANGNSPEERLRFFKAILALKPSADPDLRLVPGQEEDASYGATGSVGSGLCVEAPFHCDYGYNISIGANVVIGPDCRISDPCPVSIGNNVVFSPGVKLIGATYPIDPRERRKGRGRALGRSIVIENDVWIGSNVTILPGVRIGRCSVVAAGSVISKEVPPYLVMAGNPPVVIRAVVEEEYEPARERERERERERA